MMTSGGGKSTFLTFLRLLFDGAVYLLAIYVIQTFNLLHFDHIIPGWEYALAAAVCAGAIFLLAALHNKGRGGRRAAMAAAETALFLFIAVGPLLLMEQHPAHKGMTMYWMPTEWLKMPRAIFFGVRVSFPYFVLFAAGVLSGFYLWLRKSFSPLIYFFLLVSAGISVYSATLIEIDSRGGIYLAMMALPVILSAIAIEKKSTRLAARSLLFLLAINALLPFYFGVVPYFSSSPRVGKILCGLTPGCGMKFGGGPESPAPGMKRLYPAAGEKPGFPMAFMRDFYFDRGRSMLFSTYGPTCGFIRLETNSGRMEVMDYRSLIRYVWSEDSLDYLLAPDWINTDMLVVNKQSFNIARRIDLLSTGVRTPMSMAADDDFIYLLSTEPPALARFTKKDFQPAGLINFKALGLTPHSHGAYAFALDKANGRAFVQLGVYDFSGRFRIVRINTRTFKPEAWKDIRTGSILMTALPGKRTVLMYDYYTSRVTEISGDTLETIRTFDGVTNCRGAAYDEGRNLLYMVGAGLGELAVIDYRTGKKTGSYYVGNKASSLWYIPEDDALIVGSGDGIYLADLQNLTGMMRKAAAP